MTAPTTSRPAGRPDRPPLAPDRHRARVLSAAGAVGLALVVLLTLASAPTAVRTVLCLPLLVGIGGGAFSALLVPEQRRLDGVTRAGLVLLLGLGTLLTSALLVALLFRDGLPGDRVVLADALLAAVPLAVGATRGRIGPQRRPAVPGATVWSGVAGVALLGVALLIGTRMLPQAGPAPTFSFTGPAASAPGPGTATVGGPITLGWTVRHSAAAGPTIQAVVDGQAVPVSVQSTATGGGEFRGTATLTAPAPPGLHRIVLAAQLDGSRLELVTYTDVRPAG